jgi:hypothetical protein
MTDDLGSSVNRSGFGHHQLWSFRDHGLAGTGEPLSVLLRPGNAGSNTAADHIVVLREALRQLPGHQPGTRPGRKILIASTPRAAPTSCWSGSSGSGCRTRSGSPCPT